MKKTLYFLLLFEICACSNKNVLNRTFPSYYFNNNSAKVWVSNSNKTNAELEAYKNCFIFYANQTFRQQPKIHLGSNLGLVGNYRIASESKNNFTLLLFYADEKKSYQIVEVDASHLVLFDKKQNKTLRFNTLLPPKVP